VAETEYRVGAKAVVTDGEEVLLVTERHAGGSVFRTLPGGRVEPGETAPQALRREIREELRCECTVGRHLGACVYDHRTLPVTSLYALFGAQLRDEPQPNPDEGIIGHAWTHPDDLTDATLPPVRDALQGLADLG
jgi:8-oxo-dGTP pyrophosphatase MutT (NUDIX family)